MSKEIQKVKEFHETFDLPIGKPFEEQDPQNIELEPLESRQLRIKLIYEELAELAEASDCQQTFILLGAKYMGKVQQKKHPQELTDIQLDQEIRMLVEYLKSDGIVDGDNVNHLEEQDAIQDLKYVLAGKDVTAGYYNISDDNFDLVHQNNMTKAHRSVEHAQQTIDKNGLIGTVIKEKGEGKVLLYNSDKKLIKPHDHIKVSLSLQPKQ